MINFKNSTFALLLMASSLASAGVTNGTAQHFYSDEASDSVTVIVKEIHENYGLFVANLKSHSETYVDDNNKDRALQRGSDLTIYSNLTFTKYLDGYRAYYNTYGTNKSLIINLGIKYNSEIKAMFTDVENRADFVEIEGAATGGRGGVHLIATNLKGVKELTISCKNEIFSDKSGGNRCLTKTSVIDLANPETVVKVSGAKGETVVPKKNLKTWAKDYYENKI